MNGTREHLSQFLNTLQRDLLNMYQSCKCLPQHITNIEAILLISTYLSMNSLVINY